MVITEQERVAQTNVSERVSEEVCGQKTFTEVEDRPIVKERVERIVEHRPVEKQVGREAVVHSIYAIILFEVVMHSMLHIFGTLLRLDKTSTVRC